MKKFKKSDLRLEKEVISALTGNDLARIKGGIELVTNTCGGSIHPVSYDNNCQTMNGGVNCQVSYGGGCTVQSVNIKCELITEAVDCELKPYTRPGVSVCCAQVQ